MLHKHLNINLDLDSDLSAWLLCTGAASLAVAIVYPLLVWIIRRVRDSLVGKSITVPESVVNAASQRRDQPPAQAGQIRVRQTDLVETMSAADRQRHAEAEALLANGQVREAAAIFEAIKFQRRAVDELEKARLIDEACAVLLRLNVPGRAAIVYERNGQLETAVRLFLQVADHTSAARVYMALAQKDHRFFADAAAAYERIGKPESALVALAALMNTEQIIHVCMSSGQLVFLANYMQGRRLISDVFAHLPPTIVPQLCAALGQSPRAMSILASWTEAPNAQNVLPEIIRAASLRDDLTQIFADTLTDAAATALHKGLRRLVLPPDHIARLELALQKRTTQPPVRLKAAGQ